MTEMRGNSDETNKVFHYRTKDFTTLQDKEPHHENEGHEITGHLTIHTITVLPKATGQAKTLEFATTKTNPKHGSTIQHNLMLPVINLD